MIRAINHVQVAAPPELEERAVAFYRDVLGLEPIAKGGDSEKGAWFTAVNVEFHVGIQEKGFAPAKKAHVAFVVDSLAKWRKKLQKAGMPIKAGSAMPGWNRFFAEDPCGNRLEFMEEIEHEGTR
jgi:catechol 2,3-dioxygenase-like lactoylglutathione lyase family enzyme